jgi:hypothetical protein
MDVVVSVKRKADLPVYVNESFSTLIHLPDGTRQNQIHRKVTPEYEAKL